MDTGAPVSGVATLDALLADWIAAPRFRAWLLGAFALAALLLAAIGVYGVAAYAAAQRTREVGIRMTLGASRNDVVRTMLRRGAAMIGSGVLLGLGATLAGGRVVEAYLYGVAPTDPLTLGVGATILLAVGLLAAFLPARRASRLDPVQALRTE